MGYLSPSIPDIEQLFHWADVVLVSGGNTFFAIRRWIALGIDKMMIEAGTNGTVLAGGSAGGIVWFDGGHSDSMDPMSYKNPPGPIFSMHLGEEQLANAWAYIRTPGLSILSGLFCLHYDVTEANGVLRADSFLKTLQV